MRGNRNLGRRKALTGIAAFLATPSILRAQETPTNIPEPVVRRNISSFVLHEWRDHFDTLGKGILLSDTIHVSCSTGPPMGRCGSTRPQCP